MTKPKNNYKDGKYQGNLEDVIYGDVKIEIIIKKGKLKDINFLEYPRDNLISKKLSFEALSDLKKEAIKTQNSEVNIVSGATETSTGFIKSLESALEKARYNLKLI